MPHSRRTRITDTSPPVSFHSSASDFETRITIEKSHKKCRASFRHHSEEKRGIWPKRLTNIVR
jgi:hypothetical protein